MKSYSIVEVEWLDSGRSHNAWQDVEDYLTETAEPITCRTVGYVLRHTADRISLMQSQSSPGHVCFVIDIPTRAITRLTLVRDAEAG